MGGPRPLAGTTTLQRSEVSSGCLDAKSPLGGIGNPFEFQANAMRFTDDAAMLNCAAVGLDDCMLSWKGAKLVLRERRPDPHAFGVPLCGIEKSVSASSRLQSCRARCGCV